MSIHRKKTTEVNEKIEYFGSAGNYVCGYIRLINGRITAGRINLFGIDVDRCISIADIRDLRDLIEVATALLEELERDEEED